MSIWRSRLSISLSEIKKYRYAYSDDELNEILNEVGRDNTNKIQRYKGLERWMQSSCRILLWTQRKEFFSARDNGRGEYIPELDITFTTLMGDKVEPRREFIEANAKFVQNLIYRESELLDKICIEPYMGREWKIGWMKISLIKYMRWI